MIKGAIFDLDGVILDSMRIWNDLGVRYLQSLGVQPKQGLSEILFSMSMEQGAAYLQAQYAIPMTVSEIEAGIENQLQNFYFNGVDAKEGAQALLEFLNQNHIPMAAATSSPRIHVTKALERLNLLGYFKKIFTTGELGISKHEPVIYQMASDFLGTSPAETLVFEDSLYAAETAHRAGFFTVGVFDEAGEKNQIGLQKVADIYLRSLNNLSEIRKFFH